MVKSFVPIPFYAAEAPAFGFCFVLQNDPHILEAMQYQKPVNRHCGQSTMVFIFGPGEEGHIELPGLFLTGQRPQIKKFRAHVGDALLKAGGIGFYRGHFNTELFFVDMPDQFAAVETLGR